MMRFDECLPVDLLLDGLKMFWKQTENRASLRKMSCKAPVIEITMLDAGQRLTDDPPLTKTTLFGHIFSAVHHSCFAIYSFVLSEVEVQRMTSVERPERECSFATLYKDVFVSCFWMLLDVFVRFFSVLPAHKVHNPFPSQ